jgi:hypothetical protein
MAPAAAELSRTDPASHVRTTPRPSRRPSRVNERSVPGGITHPASSFLDFRSRPRLQNEREMPVRPAAVMFARTVIAISPRLAPRRVSSASNPSHRQLRVKHNARQRSRFCDSPGDDSSGFAAVQPSPRHFRRYSQNFFCSPYPEFRARCLRLQRKAKMLSRGQKAHRETTSAHAGKGHFIGIFAILKRTGASRRRCPERVQSQAGARCRESLHGCARPLSAHISLTWKMFFFFLL